MLTKNLSGQYLYFTLVSVFSGNTVTGASGSISGRKALDGLSGMIVLSGNIIELGGGSYRANLYDFDTNGDYAGYLFTASGCAPVTFTSVTTGGVSGNIYLNSGATVNLLSGNIVRVYSGNLSGQVVTAASGAFGTASLNSGQSVLVYSGSLSGQQVSINDIVTSLTSGKLHIASGAFTVGSLLSGQSVLVYSGSLSGQQVSINDIVTALTSGKLQIASGPFVVATASVASGSLYLASGSVFRETFASGVLGGSGGLPLSWGNSGSVVTALNQDKSGYTAGLVSGINYIASSGTLYLASGSVFPNTFSSGVLNTLVPQNILTYNYSGCPDVSGQRNLINATRKLMNRWETTGTSGYLTVYLEDDTTLVYQQAITSTSGALPITSLNTRE